MPWDNRLRLSAWDAANLAVEELDELGEEEEEALHHPKQRTDRDTQLAEDECSGAAALRLRAGDESVEDGLEEVLHPNVQHEDPRADAPAPAGVCELGEEEERACTRRAEDRGSHNEVRVVDEVQIALPHKDRTVQGW